MRTELLLKAALVAAFVAPPPPLALALIRSASAQVDECGFQYEEPVILQGGGTGCWGQSWNYNWWKDHEKNIPWQSGFQGFGYGADDPDGYHLHPTADKTINVSIHVWLHEDGGYNFNDTPLNRQRLAQMIDWISENYFESVVAPTDPATPELGYYLGTTRLRLKLAEIVFRENTYWWGAAEQTCRYQSVMNEATDVVIADRPDLKNTMILHIMGPWACPSWNSATQEWNYNDQASGTGSFPTFGWFDWERAPWAVIRGRENGVMFEPGEMGWGIMGHQWAHEIMHALGLRHVYGYTTTGDGPFEYPAFDFLKDVFSCYQQTNASNPYCPAAVTMCPPVPWTQPVNFCAQGAGSGCDPSWSQFDDCTNNVMHRYYGRHSSNGQMGIMHRSLAVAYTSKCTEGYNDEAILGFPVANMPSGMEYIWDFPMKLYQDVHIRSGQLLTIKCTAELVKEAKIVVEPGGVLLIDGGTVTNASYNSAAGYYNMPFRGIEVWGNSNQGQQNGTVSWWWNNNLTNLAHQGLVVLRNGGIIENAETGVYLGKPGDPTKAGGVIRFEGTAAEPPGVIRNCRTGVKFDPYTALANNGITALNNRSDFTRARFEWTEDYENIHGENNPIAHADLNGVRVVFRGTHFAHTGQYPEYSSQLGYGIRAHNSSAWVLPAGSSTCVFTGLDHGVHADASSTAPRLTVLGAQFNSNVCGVYAEDLRYPFIRNNTFSYGDREVVLDNPLELYWFDAHRGIFLTGCNGLRVLNNTLNGVNEPFAETEGIVIGYTTTGSESVRSNTVNGITRAYVGEGECANTSAPAAIGFQFLCNTNNGNDRNIWSRVPAGFTGSPATHTIRLNQGWQNAPALNFLDNHPQGGTNDPVDLRVSTPSLITYWHVPTANYAPTSIAGMVAPTLSGPQVLYGCPIIISGGTDQLALQNEVQQAKLAYADLRFLYANLIDGGSTDQVLEEIAEAWPQDYWDLRAYLLSRSPYLSVDALKEAMDKPGFPDAMRAEICIANPEATQREGFLRWLEFECIAPLPEQLLENIVASWDNRTYRATLEMQMGAEHLRMSEAAYTLAELRAADDADEGADLAEELADLQALRTAEARYGEAMHLLGQHDYAAARAVIEALHVEHELKGREVYERARMLAYIGFLEEVHLDGRTEAQLTPAEIATLQDFIAVEHDKPTQWASHLLCYHYSICRSPYTGDAGAEPKALVRPRKAEAKPAPTLVLKPNPANAYVVVSYDEKAAAGRLKLLIRDALGRPVHEELTTSNAGQVLVDTRSLPAGAYLVEMRSPTALVVSERLIIQP